MRSAMLTILMAMFTAIALAQDSDSAIDNETPAADPATDKAETTTAAKAAEKKKEKEEFKPPPGFQAKKRGDKTLYCIRDSTVGTRFKTEKCYDEVQMKDYVLAREQNNRDFDRSRAVCSNPRACGQP